MVRRRGAATICHRRGHSSDRRSSRRSWSRKNVKTDPRAVTWSSRPSDGVGRDGRKSSNPSNRSVVVLCRIARRTGRAKPVIQVHRISVAQGNYLPIIATTDTRSPSTSGVVEVPCNVALRKRPPSRIDLPVHLRRTAVGTVGRARAGIATSVLRRAVNEWRRVCAPVRQAAAEALLPDDRIISERRSRKRKTEE